MAGGVSRKISAASARAHTRRAKKSSSSPISSGLLRNIAVLLFFGFLAWGYQAIQPPAPKICGSPDGPPITAPRIKLRDGRYLAYKEQGVPKDSAKYKIIYVHSFRSCRHDVAIANTISPDIIDNLGIYILSFDKSGYGESDPNPNRTPKTIAYDIEELADQLELGSKFYVVGFSMGGQAVWSCLKYIPNRLAGAALLAPVVNYWWPGFPANLTNEAFYQQFRQDQWTVRVAHYTPWLTYWWNTQKWFPSSSVVAANPEILSRQDKELLSKKVGRNECEDALSKPKIEQWCKGNENALRDLGNLLNISQVKEIIKGETKLVVMMGEEKFPMKNSLLPFAMLLLGEKWKEEGSSEEVWKGLANQQGEYESIHKDANVGFGKWEFSPLDLENPFPGNEGSVHLWHGDEDKIVPVTLLRYIAKQLPWIHYHEIAGAGHSFPYADGMSESIIKTLLLNHK
ncbi:Abhydrolase_6 domain-containing protein [Cucumis melo var. makuwa]|uniref:Abhydrolase_6 domain-containing protein n=1 Tax=Cucumis melo var. makuwa TaxID=1194695 RepID=A0A5A7TM03_CUCMM|nr:Abhydrolase_6 domain-containing protein [Cucumis melo var. makuwa]TYK25249.1 Abhydrolase_6 domain-containing protein [Cucumis melo var. makuwa]